MFHELPGSQRVRLSLLSTLIAASLTLLIPPGAASAATTGPGLGVGTASLASGKVVVPIDAFGSGFTPYMGFNVHLRWDPAVFSYSSYSAASGPFDPANPNALCADTTLLDGDGGGVVVGCVGVDLVGGGPRPVSTKGLLVKILLTPKAGCSNLHLVTYGAPDGGGDTAGSYTVDGTTAVQSNAVVNGSAGISGTPCSSVDTDADGYADGAELNLGKDPLTYCAIMRADVDANGVVSILDLTQVASQYAQSIPPGNPRYDQNKPPDNQISILDLTIQASVYGQPVSACP